MVGDDAVVDLGTCCAAGGSEQKIAWPIKGVN